MTRRAEREKHESERREKGVGKKTGMGRGGGERK